jgi:hypothetical protein
MHAKHDVARGHRYLCRMNLVRSLEVSEAAGLGNIEFHKNVGAVLQREEGIVALLDVSDPARPKVTGRYMDGATDSFDGDLAFAHDGAYLFYGRQTHQFSKDGVHVLDVSDPTAPTSPFYLASGGTLQVAYHYDGTDEWVIFLDALDGLVVTRFVRASGSLVEVFRDPDPVASKVGGPASAGLFVDPKDPATGNPLLYVSTGGSGLQIYDFADPTAPALLGEWNEVGLADLVVRRTSSTRIVYAATEYWFDKTLTPRVIVLDATDPASISEKRALSLGLPADDQWRVQGMTWAGRRLLIAHSHAGLVAMNQRGRLTARALIGGAMNSAAEPPPKEQAGFSTAAYAMDVERKGPFVYLSDAATGMLHVLRSRR